MHMIGHHRPLVQPVPYSIEMEQGIFDNVRQTRIAQDARSIPRVQGQFNAPASLSIALVIGKIADLRFPFRTHVIGETIGKAKDDVLWTFTGLPMGQV